ncbi:uncharacterized protein LOC126677269 isoform X2 [Mercurialis annua]|uniref:uncharacterized protein LOC126677269 isoform X2 n=1 Tax=Mercurialis annua TaxID=3986 RepID=UPI0021605479|nr:uncharacterized protein LOC126677269 isoform X2 [Mercurialis annua]
MGTEESSAESWHLNFRNKMSSWWRRNLTWRTLGLLLLCQLVSIVMAFMGFSSSLIAKLGVDAPASQGIFTYLSLALVYGSILVYRNQKPMVSWYWYLLLGFLDSQSLFLYNTSFHFTSITSVTMLQSFSIAWVIVLTWFFLGSRYSLWQFFGAALCVLGLGLLILSDVGVGGGGASRTLFGDMIVIAGTLLFALSNVGEEFCVKNKDRVEMLAMIGAYGLLIVALAAYTLSSFTLYSLFSFVLQMSGATMYNLSTPASNMWVVIIQIFFYHQQVGWLYYVSFAIVVTGLVMYSTNEKDPVSISNAKDSKYNAEYQALDNEDGTSRIQLWVS